MGYARWGLVALWFFVGGAPAKEISPRAGYLKKADWVIIAHTLIPFRVDLICAYPSRFRFEVEKTLYASKRAKPFPPGKGIEVADADYDMLEADCKRKQQMAKEPTDFRTGNLPEKLVLYVYLRKRLGIKSRVELVAPGSYEPLTELPAILKELAGKP